MDLDQIVHEAFVTSGYYDDEGYDDETGADLYNVGADLYNVGQPRRRARRRRTRGGGRVDRVGPRGPREGIRPRGPGAPQMGPLGPFQVPQEVHQMQAQIHQLQMQAREMALAKNLRDRLQAEQTKLLGLTYGASPGQTGQGGIVTVPGESADLPAGQFRTALNFSDSVAAGATVRIEREPQWWFYGTAPQISDTLAPDIQINEIFVQNLPQLPDGGPIDGDGLRRDSWHKYLQTRWCPPGNKFALSVTNTSAAALTVNITYWGVATVQRPGGLHTGDPYYQK